MIADICVIAIVAFFVYIGYRSGLMRSVVRIASYIVSIIVSLFLYPVISDILIKTPIYEKLTSIISEKYIMQDFADSASVTFGILAKYVERGAESVASGIAGSIATLIINVLAFVVVLILSKLIIRIVSRTFNIFTKLPVIKQFNRLGGAILGGLSGVLVLYIAFAVLFLFSPIDPQSRVAAEIEESTLASEIYENNIIVNFIGEGK